MKFPILQEQFYTQEELDSANSFMKSILDAPTWRMLKEITREQIETDMLVPVVDHFLARAQCSLPEHKVPEEILRKPKEEAKKINPNAQIRFVSFVRYSNQFGFPQLGPHLDPVSKEHFFFDVQLDGNVDWPIVVAEEDPEAPDKKGNVVGYSLKNNDSLCIEITRQAHWRTPVKFKDGDFIDMIFISFEDPNIEPPTLEWQTEIGLKYMDDYEAELELIYPKNTTMTFDQRAEYAKNNVKQMGKLDLNAVAAEEGSGKKQDNEISFLDNKKDFYTLKQEAEAKKKNDDPSCMVEMMNEMREKN
jgi:hypothetical protein